MQTLCYTWYQDSSHTKHANCETARVLKIRYKQDTTV